jgi:hypothetical protein
LCHEQIVINPIKEFREIDIYRNTATLLDDVFNLFYRLLPIAIWPKSEAIVREVGIEDGRKDLGNGLLNNTITDGCPSL